MNVDDEAARLETPAAYQRSVHFPTVLTQQSGTLRLAAGRLAFRTSRGRVLFDGSLNEFHSLAPCYAGSGMHLWQGDRCHVLVFPRYGIPPVGGDGLIGVAISLEATREAAVNMPRSRAEVLAWSSLLRPLIAQSPPPGVDVRAPFSTPRVWVTTAAAVLGACVVLLAMIVALVMLTS